jgi:hypothetical protein
MINDLVADREICQEAQKKGVVIESKYWWANFNCKMCSEGGGFQGWCLCEKSIVGDPTIKTSKDGKQYTEGEIQMYPIGDENILDPWHYEKECPAPLTDEILQILPDNIKDVSIIVKTKNGFGVFLVDITENEDEEDKIIIEDKKLSNAMLLLAIKLKEDGKILI